MVKVDPERAGRVVIPLLGAFWLSFYLYLYLRENPLTFISLQGLQSISWNLLLLLLLNGCVLSSGNILFHLLTLIPGLSAPGRGHGDVGGPGAPFTQVQRLLIHYGTGWLTLSLLVHFAGLLGLLDTPFILYLFAFTVFLIIPFFPVNEVRGCIDRLREVLGVPGSYLLPCLALFSLLPPVLSAFSPPLEVDELFYHLSLPSLFLREGRVFATEDIPMTAFPLGGEMLYTLGLALSTDIMPRLINLSFGIFTILALFSILMGRGGRGRTILLSFLLLGGTAPFLKEFGLAYPDLMASFYLLIAFSLLENLEGRGDLPFRILLFSLFSGFSTGLKYTSLYMLLPLFLYLLIVLRGKGVRFLLRLSPFILIPFLIPLIPLILKNIIFLENILYPFINGSVDGPAKGAYRFIFTEKYGMGRDLLSILLAPFNMSLHGREGTYLFQGRLNPALVLLLPFSASLLFMRGRVHYLLIPLTALILWAMGPHSIRYLIPQVPFLVLMVTVPMTGVFERGGNWRRAITFALFLVSGIFFLSSVVPLYRSASGRLNVMLHPEERDLFLKENIVDYPIIDYIRRFTKRDIHVAFFFEGASYYLERRFSFPSIEDHRTTRSLLSKAESPEGLLGILKDRGVTHALVREPVFRRKNYTFLSEEEFEKGFEFPSTLFERFRNLYLTLEYRQRDMGFYRIDYGGEG